LVTSSLELAVTKSKPRTNAQAIRRSGLAATGPRLFRIGDGGLHPFTNRKTEKTFLEILQNLQDHKEIASAREKLNDQGRASTV
jgi:hypothetical protein